MIAHTENSRAAVQAEPDWLRIVRHLVRKAFARRTPLPREELLSLAGLAVAQARHRFDPARCRCGIGVWTCHTAWLRLRSLIRDERLRARRRGICMSDYCRTDVPGRTESDLAPPVPDAAWSLEPDWLERLDPLDRRVLRMRTDGYTLAQIARGLGRTQDAVRWRLRRVRSLVARLDAQAVPRNRTTRNGAMA